MRRKPKNDRKKLDSANGRQTRSSSVPSSSQIPKGADFWRSRSIEELAREQGVEVVHDPNELTGHFWPQGESIDDFLVWLRKVRREGREQS